MDYFDRLFEIETQWRNKKLSGSEKIELIKCVLDDYADEKFKNFNLHIVSNRRELLIAAAKGIYPHGDQKQLTKLIDKYLQGN